MYGDSVGKIAIFAVILILCLFRMGWIVFSSVFSDEQQTRGGISTLVHLLLPAVFIYFTWHLLWH